MLGLYFIRLIILVLTLGERIYFFNTHTNNGQLFRQILIDKFIANTTPPNKNPVKYGLIQVLLIEKDLA